MIVKGVGEPPSGLDLLDHRAEVREEELAEPPDSSWAEEPM
jgi:hypothetical protein